MTTQDVFGEFRGSTEALRKALADLSYACACEHLSLLRFSRALWPHLPLWQRVWLTLQRKGW